MNEFERREAQKLLGLGTVAMGTGYTVCVRAIPEPSALPFEVVRQSVKGSKLAQSAGMVRNALLPAGAMESSQSGNALSDGLRACEDLLDGMDDSIRQELAMPASDEWASGAADLEVIPSEPGAVLHTARLNNLRADKGILVADLERSDGVPFRVQICRRDDGLGAPKPVARTGRYDLFLANGGRGTKRTHEEEGLALYALASRVARHERSHPVMSIETKRQWWRHDHGKIPG